MKYRIKSPLLFIILSIFIFKTATTAQQGSEWKVQKDIEYQKNLEAQRKKPLPVISEEKLISGAAKAQKTTGEALKKLSESSEKPVPVKKNIFLFWKKDKPVTAKKLPQQPVTQPTFAKHEETGSFEFVKTVNELLSSIDDIDTKTTEKLGKIKKSLELSEQERDMVIEIGNKILQLSPTSLALLTPEQRLKAYQILHARTAQLQTADNALAEISEKMEGPLQHKTKLFIQDERRKNTPEEEIQQRVEKNVEFNRVKAEIAQKKNSFKSLYGFDPQVKDERLKKANDLKTALVGEISLRQSVVDKKRVELDKLEKNPSVSPDDLKAKKADYLINFVELQKALQARLSALQLEIKRTNLNDEQKKQIAELKKEREKLKQDQVKLIKNSKAILKSAAPDYLKSENQKLTSLASQIQKIQYGMSEINKKTFPIQLEATSTFNVAESERSAITMQRKKIREQVEKLEGKNVDKKLMDEDSALKDKFDQLTQVMDEQRAILDKESAKTKKLLDEENKLRAQQSTCNKNIKILKSALK